MRFRSAVALDVAVLLLLSTLSLAAIEISGTVVDENNKPLAGVRVAAGEVRSVSSLTTGIEAATDADGQFVIRGIPEPVESHGIAVEAYTPGRVPLNMYVELNKLKPLKLTLVPARSITIQLLELNGRPASGVKVTAAELSFPSLWNLITETGPDGKVTITTAPEKGSLCLSVADVRYVHSDINLRLPDDDGAKFRVIPGGAIEGKVVDGTGKPVSGASVRAMANTLGFWGGYGSTVTGSLGKFRISRLDSEDFIVYVAPSETYAAEPIECKVTRGKVTQLPIVKAAKPGRIEGIILDDETGKPVGDLQISYEPATWSSGWGGESVSANKDGRFVILAVGSLSASPYLFSQSAYPYEANSDLDKDFALRPGETVKWDIRLRKTAPPGLFDPFTGRPAPALKPADRLSVVVLDEQDRPVPSCDLRLLRYDQKEGPAKDSLTTAKTDEQGLASVPVPEGETFVWVASKAGYCDAWNATTRFVSDPVVLRLYREQAVRGRVVNEAGKAVPNARVTAKSAVGYYYDGRRLTAIDLDLAKLCGRAASYMTDGKGGFVLPGIPTNSGVSIELTHPSFLKTRARVPMPNADVELVAIKPSEVRGGISPAYPSLAKVPLVVKVRWMGNYEAEQTAPINPDGTFVLRGAPSGSAIRDSVIYGRASLALDPNRPVPEGVTIAEATSTRPYRNLVSIKKPDGRILRFTLGESPINARTIADKNGVQMPISPVVRITGVLLGKDGKPFPKGQVDYQDAVVLKDGMNGWRSAETDANGRWTIHSPLGPLNLAAIDDENTFAGYLKFKSVLEASRKDIVLDLSKPATAGPSAMKTNVTEFLRVLNPDGVAVPRPQVKAEGGENPLFEQGSGLDGTVAIRALAGTRVTVTSPYLKKPVFVELQKDDRRTTITFDYAQKQVPSVQELTQTTGIGFG
jgi:protocatechuate 3,4-dioxygenase beta subunit/5-hydroxyisourate hydrolase-like protein (transthyretin family)